MIRFRYVAYGVVISVVTLFLYRCQAELSMTRLLVDRLKQEVSASGQDKNIDISDVARNCSQVRQLTWREVQNELKDAVVQIFVPVAEFNWLEPYKTPNQGFGHGSGFIISDRGEIITNAHVVDQARAVAIQIPSLGKQRFDVDVIGVSPERDLALLRLRPEAYEDIVRALGRIPSLRLGDSDNVYRAEEIMAVGYPLAQQSLKSTTGVVSGREHIGSQHMIQISAPINPGSSGGPAINMAGEVVGVSRAIIANAQNVGYIIPSNEVKLFLRQLDQMADVGGSSPKLLRKPFLGVIFNNANETLTRFLGNKEPGGLYVVEALKGSPLYEAGVQPGDMLYEIDGHRLDVFGEMNVPWSEDKVSIVDYVSRLMLGEKVHLLVYRRGTPLQLELTFKHSDLMGVRQMFPGYEKIEYEVFGGLVLMQLALNHLPLLLQASPDLARYSDLHKQMQPAVVITHVLPDSSAFRSRTLGLGAVIEELNGEPVKTLEDVRRLARKSSETGFLTIKTNEKVFTVLSWEAILKQERALSRGYFYPITDFMQEMLALYEKNKKAS